MGTGNDEAAVAREERRFGNEQLLQPIGERTHGGKPFGQGGQRTKKLARRGLEDSRSSRRGAKPGAGKAAAKGAEVAGAASAERDARAAARDVRRISTRGGYLPQIRFGEKEPYPVQTRIDRSPGRSMAPQDADANGARPRRPVPNSR